MNGWRKIVGLTICRDWNNSFAVLFPVVIYNRLVSCLIKTHKMINFLLFYFLAKHFLNFLPCKTLKTYTFQVVLSLDVAEYEFTDNNSTQKCLVSSCWNEMNTTSLVLIGNILIRCFVNSAKNKQKVFHLSFHIYENALKLKSQIKK